MCVCVHKCLFLCTYVLMKEGGVAVNFPLFLSISRAHSLFVSVSRLVSLFSVHTNIYENLFLIF